MHLVRDVSRHGASSSCRAGEPEADEERERGEEQQLRARGRVTPHARVCGSVRAGARGFAMLRAYPLGRVEVLVVDPTQPARQRRKPRRVALRRRYPRVDLVDAPILGEISKSPLAASSRLRVVAPPLAIAAARESPARCTAA